MAKRGGYCVVFNSTSKGKPNRVVGCFLKKSEAERAMHGANRTASFGGFYSLHRKSVVESWRSRGDAMNYEGLSRRAPMKRK